MTVKELMLQLKQMPDYAEVYVIPPYINDRYFKVVDCECEFSDIVSLGTENE